MIQRWVEMCEMRECKGWGEVKPLETAFQKCYGKPNKCGEVKTYCEKYCRSCRYRRHAITPAHTEIEARKTVVDRHKAETGAMRAAIKAQEEASERVKLFKSLEASRTTCPILSLGLWTGDVPQQLGAW